MTVQPREEFYKMIWPLVTISSLKQGDAGGCSGVGMVLPRCCVRLPPVMKDDNSSQPALNLREVEERRGEFEPDLKAVFKQRPSLPYKDKIQTNYTGRSQ